MLKNVKKTLPLNLIFSRLNDFHSEYSILPLFHSSTLKEWNNFFQIPHLYKKISLSFFYSLPFFHSLKNIILFFHTFSTLMKSILFHNSTLINQLMLKVKEYIN